MGKKEKEIIDLTEMNVILQIPENCKKVVIHAEVEIDGEVKTVKKKLKKKDIKAAREDFNAWIGDEDYNAVYVLTDEGREYLEKLKAEQENQSD